MKHVQHCCWLALIVLILAPFSAPTAVCQDSDIEKAIRAFDQNNVGGYIQPMADFFGANMSAGWYHSASIPTTGLNISLNVIAMGSSVGDDQKTFTAQAPTGFSPSTFKTATVFGGTGATVTDQNTSLEYRGSDGALNTPIFPLAALQLNIGSIYGTEVIIRGVPLPEISGAPKVTFLGFGVRHSVSQYLPEFPVDIAAGVFYNHIAFGDIIDMKSFAFGAQGSKSFSVLEIYGGFAYESSSMDLSYTATTAGSPKVSISLDGANKFRATLGVGLNLAILHIFGDVNVGTVTNFSAGIGFGN
jgi:Family of unknown function (DUF6588)